MILNIRGFSTPTLYIDIQYRTLFTLICGMTKIWVPFQYPIWRLIVRSRKVLQPRDLYLELYDRSEFWQAPRQQCCRCACQISKRYENFDTWSRAFETLRDLTMRRLIGYWNGGLGYSFWGPHFKSYWEIHVKSRTELFFLQNFSDESIIIFDIDLWLC